MTDPLQDVERLHRLQGLTDVALGHLQLDELLAALLVRTRDILGVDTCAVLLHDEETHELVASAAVGIEEEVEQGVRVPIGRGFAGRIAADRRPVILDDVDHADVVNQILHDKGIKSMLGVPLLIEDTVLGVLHVGSLSPRSFTSDDVELLQFVAHRAAIAIDHARLYESERAARTQLEHVQTVTDVALAHLELEDLLGVMLPRIRDILGVDTCAVLLHDEETHELVASAAVGIEEEVEQGVRVPIGRGFAGRIAADRRPVILDDVDHADVVNQILHDKGIKSMLGVPLLIEDTVLGVLHVGSLSPRSFTSDDVKLLQLVGDRVALAIERARLHDEMLRLDQLKLNFVAIASHELRTPATAVYGVLATLVERGDELSAGERDELLRMGYEQGDRLRRLLEQLLDLSRLDAQAIKIERKPLVLRAVLAEIAEAAVSREVRVELDVPSDLAVAADPLVLDRVVSNLLVNAARYGKPPFVVTAIQRDRHLRVSVFDHGPGVPEELRARLFDRFTRGESARGTGLGLTIARAYARAHGGDLVYQPDEHGSRFELFVPQD